MSITVWLTPFGTHHYRGKLPNEASDFTGYHSNLPLLSLRKDTMTPSDWDNVDRYASKMNEEMLAGWVDRLTGSGFRITHADLPCNSGTSARAKFAFRYALIRLPGADLPDETALIELMAQCAHDTPLVAGESPAQIPVAASTTWPPTSVLFLSAGPMDAGRLRTDHELKVIKEELSKMGSKKPELVSHDAVERSKIGQWLLEVDPELLHFGGHGISGQLVFEDGVGNSAGAPLAAIAKMLNSARCRAKWIVLTACESFDCAASLVEGLGGLKREVVCCRGSIGDEKAVQFTRGLYRALSHASATRFASFSEAVAYAIAESGLVEEDGEIIYVHESIQS